ncbi:MAG: RHS repeat-associated core domain-containing protein [Acidobacteriota bacterium]
MAGKFHVHAPDAWTARVIHYTWLLSDGTSPSAGSAQGISGAFDDLDVQFGGFIPPTKGGTLIATLDSCGDEFSSVAVDAGGDHSCDISERNQPPGCPNCVGEPIRLDDGNMQITQIDPLPAFAGAAMKRTYHSDGPSSTWFGAGWSSMFDRALYVYPYVVDGPWVVIWLDGTKRYVFHAVQGNFVQAWPLGSQRATLTVDPATGAYTLREPARDIEIVMEPNTGLPVSYRSRSTGRALAISYDGTTPVHVSDSWDTFGWTITSNQHQIQSIAIDGTSLAWQYVYTGGILTAVNGPGGGAWRSYTYSGNNLTQARDGAGKLLESHAYNNFARATTSLQREGDIQSIDYSVATRNTSETMTRVTTAAGAVTNYWIAYFGGRARVVEIQGNCTSCGTNDAVFAYKPADYTHPGGELLRMQDARGYVTEWTYDSADRVVSVARGYKPAGCNPENDASHCRKTPDDLRTILLDATAESETTSYGYANTDWPDRPTTIVRSSVASPGNTATQTLTYDTATGTVLTDTVHGYNGTASETHVTTTVLYTLGEPAAFNPGGAFSSAWVSLPQPNGLRKSVDGPRTEAPDVTQWVYYPIAAAVPQFWRGRVAAIRDAAGHVTRFENYDVFGNPTRVVDANGVATEYTYDGSGRVLTSTLKGNPGCDMAADPLCGTDLVTTRTYDAFGPLVSETRLNGATTTYEYDERGRVKATTRPVSTSVSERVEYDYDPLTGKKSAERYLSGQPGSWTVARSEAFRYDIYGRLIAVDHPDGTSVGYAYDGANNIVSVKDENHTTPNTTYKYDPENRLIRVTQTLSTAAGGAINTQYAYDLHGNLTSVVDPNGSATTYQFDDFSRMKQQVSPVSGTTAYAYDLAGNLTSTTDANGATTTRTYDALGRVTQSVSSKSGALETVAWSYDDQASGSFGRGRVGTMTDPTGSTSYKYDRRGLLRSEIRIVNGAPYTTTFGYDADGNRSAITYPSGRTVTYSFDFAGRPIAASSGSTVYISSAAYLPFGPMTRLVYGNGTTRTMSFDSRSRPMENKLVGPGGTIAEYDYSPDPAGNIIGIFDAVEPAYNRGFVYDDLNRLTFANSTSSLWGGETYAYDAMGNMLRRYRPVGSGFDYAGRGDAAGGQRYEQTTFTYAGQTSKLALADSHAVEYDAVGNETFYLGSRTYSPRNLMSSMTASGHRDNQNLLGYGYDGRGVRVWSSEQFPLLADYFTAHAHIYSPELRPLARHDFDVASGIAYPTGVTEFVWFGDTTVAQHNPNGALRYTMSDHLGTPFLQTDATATVVWRAEYEPYGEIFRMRSGTASEQPLRFPGQEVATTTEGREEQYNIFRWYRPGWGRYTQADPIGLRGGMNLYAYAAENPISFIDPLGLKVYKCCRYVQVNPFIDLASRILGLRHCFLKTDTREGGMGPAGDGPLPAWPFGVPTAVRDHRGQSQESGTTCTEIRGVDEQCVNNALTGGCPTGPWATDNNCNTFVDQVLWRCNPCRQATRPAAPASDNGRRYF